MQSGQTEGTSCLSLISVYDQYGPIELAFYKGDFLQHGRPSKDEIDPENTQPQNVEAN